MVCRLLISGYILIVLSSLCIFCSLFHPSNGFPLCLLIGLTSVPLPSCINGPRLPSSVCQLLPATHSLAAFRACH